MNIKRQNLCIFLFFCTILFACGERQLSNEISSNVSKISLPDFQISEKGTFNSEMIREEGVRSFEYPDNPSFYPNTCCNLNQFTATAVRNSRTQELGLAYQVITNINGSALFRIEAERVSDGTNIFVDERNMPNRQDCNVYGVGNINYSNFECGEEYDVSLKVFVYDPIVSGNPYPIIPSNAELCISQTIRVSYGEYDSICNTGDGDEIQ